MAHEFAKKAVSRLSLLAGGSLSAATLVLAGAGGVALTPTPAKAAFECGNPTTNGAAPDTFTCTDATTYPSITYPSTSGNLTLRLQNDVTVTTGGIVVTPSGTNSVTITRIADTAPASGDPQITSTAGPGISVVRTTGSGAINVTLNDTDDDDAPMSIAGTTAGILVSNVGTGGVSVATTNGTITATNGYAVNLGTSGTGIINFNNGSTLSGSAGAITITQGVRAFVANGGSILGSVSFNNTGDLEFTNKGIWRAEGVSFFGSGANSSLINDVGGNTGRIAISGATEGAATLTLTGVEIFTNRGIILFGTNSDYTDTDHVANDRLVTSVFGSEPGGLLVMDFLAGAGDQESCAAAVVADCMDVRGGTFAGAVEVLLNPVASSGTTMADRLVLIDVTGGVATATVRVSVDSPGYFTDFNGRTAIEAGAFAYTLQFDNDQYYLTSGPGPSPVRVSHLGEAGLTAWDLTTGTWFDRQADLRYGIDHMSGGVWLRGVSSYTDNDIQRSSGLFTYDTSNKQTSAALVGGVDLIGSPDGSSHWVAGVTGGYVDSKMKFADRSTEYELNGYSLGAYVTWLSGPMFVDGVVNYARLDSTSTAFAEDGEVRAFGAQVEGGYQLAVADAVFVEPLAALAYVNSQVEDVTLADGAVIEVDDLTSLRAGLGLRLSGDAEMMGLTTKFALTGRAWHDFDGEVAETIASNGESLAFDDNRPTLGDVALSVRVFGLAERLSLNFSAGLKFKENYETVSGAIGARYSF